MFGIKAMREEIEKLRVEVLDLRGRLDGRAREDAQKLRQSTLNPTPDDRIERLARQVHLQLADINALAEAVGFKRNNHGSNVVPDRWIPEEVNTKEAVPTTMMPTGRLAFPKKRGR